MRGAWGDGPASHILKLGGMLVSPGFRTEPCRARRGLWQSLGATAWPHRCSPHGGGGGTGHPGLGTPHSPGLLLPPSLRGWTRPLVSPAPKEAFKPRRGSCSPGEFSAHSRGISVPQREFPASTGAFLPHLRVFCPPGGIPASQGGFCPQGEFPGGIPVAPESLLIPKGGVPPLSRGILPPGRFLSPGGSPTPGPALTPGPPTTPSQGAWPGGGVAGGVARRGDGDAVGGAGRGGSGGSGGFQRLRRAVSAGGAALPTGDARPRAGPPGGALPP